jgi:hypothetical protein
MSSDPTEEALPVSRLIDCQVALDDAFRELWESRKRSLTRFTNNHLTALREHDVLNPRLSSAKGED